jgi:hypothetical protein
MLIDSGSQNELPDNDDYNENLDPTTEVPEVPADWPADLEAATREYIMTDPTLWAARVLEYHDNELADSGYCPFPDECVYGCDSE